MSPQTKSLRKLPPGRRATEGGRKRPVPAWEGAAKRPGAAFRPVTVQNAGTGRVRPPSEHSQRGFTLLEVLLALALTALVLLSLNTFVFSMGELWGRNADLRLFDRHVRAVTRYLDQELRTAGLPPSAGAGAKPIAPQEIKPLTGSTENLLTFELPAGSRLLVWPDRPLPEVVCSLQAREGTGLVLLWHSRLEQKFSDDPPRETVITPLVTALAYDYYDADFKTWKTEPAIRRDTGGQLQAPQRLRLTFTYGKLKRESVIALPMPTEGLPNF